MKVRYELQSVSADVKDRPEVQSDLEKLARDLPLTQALKKARALGGEVNERVIVVKPYASSWAYEVQNIGVKKARNR